MQKLDVVQTILENTSPKQCCAEAYAFAPSNLALCKYWGKRDEELNLPVTSSLSISLGNYGAFTRIAYETNEKNDVYLLNGKEISLDTKFGKRLYEFLNLFRPNKKFFYHIETDLNIPVAAGLASSACGFAALVLALNNFYDWQLDKKKLSILARLGSGSAARSFWKGFVEWHMGSEPNGMDSFGELFPYIWPDLRIGTLIFSENEKNISSRDAMRNTLNTSPLYAAWPEEAAIDLENIKRAILEHDFELFGKTAEANAMMMHEMMLNSEPPIQYSLPETYTAMQIVHDVRQMGAEIFMTQDAGPNLQLLFQAKDTGLVEDLFPDVKIIVPFETHAREQVISVDSEDREIGIVEKIAAHQSGTLHRAFSVFILREKNGEVEVLLQKRQASKYHSANLWSNTCCGHPRPSEEIVAAAKRRLEEEMGFSVRLKDIGTFQYKTELPNGLLENEIDHVLVGVIGNESPLPNPHEVQATAWIQLDVLRADLELSPAKYTLWLSEALALVQDFIS